MAYRSTYLAAGTVAKTIEDHFAKHLACAQRDGEEDLAPAPSAAVVEEIIDAAFWASLRKEEGHSPKISIAFLPPEQAGNPLLFGYKLSLNPAALTKLAPGVEQSGIHLGVWYEGNDLHIWGTTTKIPNFCFVLDVSEPGLIVVKHRRIHGFGKYTNVAVLKGDQVKIVNEASASLPDSPAILISLLGASVPASWNDPANVLIQLAVFMRSHGRGGSVLVVPSGTDAWQESIIKPMQYRVEPSFSGLADLVRQDETEVSEIFWQSALRREVGNISGLTAVDGATVISDKFELLAFGAKIGRAQGKAFVEQVAFTEPIIDGEGVIMHPSKIGGTRHLSAAQFVHDQPDSIALVASQDGHFTVFAWSPHHQMLHAYRIDTLLL
jgi:hypothetical protein